MLSVIVTSYGSPDVLKKCLASLGAQPSAWEIVVSDCSPESPELALGGLFPDVRFLHSKKTLTVPELRWGALRECKGDLVAAVEGRCVPSDTWCSDLVRAHETFPDAPAVGGPVDIARPASAFDLGLYFSEYGAFAPPLAEEPVTRISGANLSYKRFRLEENPDLLGSGAWETLLHDRWTAAGLRLRLSSARVTFQNTLSRRAALAQRFHYGRGYASDRVAGAGILERLLHAGFCPLLPFLLIARVVEPARRSGMSRDLVRALPWLLALDAAWSAGELVGYLFGKSAARRIF
jgi:hypothetical protein